MALEIIRRDFSLVGFEPLRVEECELSFLDGGERDVSAGPWIRFSAGHRVAERTDTGPTLADDIVWMADLAQYELMDDLREPWPKCPQAGYHPLYPDVVAGEAVWRCEQTRDVICRVGELAAQFESEGRCS